MMKIAALKLTSAFCFIGILATFILRNKEIILDPIAVPAMLAFVLGFLISSTFIGLKTWKKQ